MGSTSTCRLSTASIAGEYEKATRSAAEGGSRNTIVTRRSSRTHAAPRNLPAGQLYLERCAQYAAPNAPQARRDGRSWRLSSREPARLGLLVKAVIALEDPFRTAAMRSALPWPQDGPRTLQKAHSWIASCSPPPALPSMNGARTGMSESRPAIKARPGQIWGGLSTRSRAPISTFCRHYGPHRQAPVGAPNGGSVRGYLANSSRRQRSSHHEHPQHDTERSLDIYADRRVRGERPQLPRRARRARCDPASAGRPFTHNVDSHIARYRTPDQPDRTESTGRESRYC